MDTCPSDDDLALFLAGDDNVSIGQHLRDCARCQQTLDRLSDDDSLRPGSLDRTHPSWDWGDPVELGPIVAALRNQSCFEPGTGTSAMPPSRLFALDPPQVPDTLGSLGPYDVEAEIGHGGMGTVFRARDRTTGRLVAIKVLFVGNDDERTRRRFLQEVRAAARVDHDHIVRLYATSDPAERVPYFVMEYIAGLSLADTISTAGRIPPREAAEITAQAASGIQAAHSAGLIHSDVKPANILIDSATGRAKIGDFGLARLDSENIGVSREGLLPGTPAYLSPEQARGEPTPDPRSDIYGLGVTLYESLTGEPPFRGEPHRVIHQVLNDEPTPPRVFNDAIPRDLETICLKAMAKDASRRYATAANLAEDLGRFLKGEAILARPAGTAERFWRWCRNNRGIAALTAIVSVLLITLSVGSLVASILIYRARSSAISSASRAEIQRGLAIDALTSLVQGIQDQLATRPGTLELRRSLLEIAKNGLTKVPATDSISNTGEVDDRTIQALIKIGDIDLILGKTADARAEYDQAAALAERVSSTNPQSVPIRRQLASAYDRVGDAISHTYTVNDKDEKVNRDKALQIRQALIAELPEDPGIRRDFVVTQNKLAHYFAKASDFDRARSLYQSSLASLKAEPITPANRGLVLSDIRFVQGRLAGYAYTQGNASEAISAFHESLATARALCDIDPHNVSYLRQLGFALDYLGTACTDFNEFDQAQKALDEFRANRQAAVDADPADQDASRSLALADQHLGDLANRRSDISLARKFYLAALARFENIAQRDPASVMAHRDRLTAIRLLVDLEANAGQIADAANWAERELEANTAKNAPAYPEQAAHIAEEQLYRDAYRLLDQCIDNPALARKQHLKLSRVLLNFRAVVLARAGRDADAAEAAREILTWENAPYAPWFAARAYAIAAASVATSHPEKRPEYIKSAIAALRLAIANKVVRVATLPYQPEFEPLRDDPEFIALVPTFSSTSKTATPAAAPKTQPH